jgi:hypothetical protein
MSRADFTFLFRRLRRGQCRACKTTEPDTPWTDHMRTHCQRCYCAECGRKFLTSSDYIIDRQKCVKVCRARKRCAEERARRRRQPGKVASMSAHT